MYILVMSLVQRSSTASDIEVVRCSALLLCMYIVFMLVVILSIPGCELLRGIRTFVYSFNRDHCFV